MDPSSSKKKSAWKFAKKFILFKKRRNKQQDSSNGNLMQSSGSNGAVIHVNNPGPSTSAAGPCSEQLHLEMARLQVQEQQASLQLEPSMIQPSTSSGSSQCDEAASVAPNVVSVYCGNSKQTDDEIVQMLKDRNMWLAPNTEVIKNLLKRKGTTDDLIKWEAIATSRGLCTLTNGCACHDCFKSKLLAGIADGDAGLGAVPLFNAINVGCNLL